MNDMKLKLFVKDNDLKRDLSVIDITELVTEKNRVEMLAYKIYNVLMNVKIKETDSDVIIIATDLIRNDKETLRGGCQISRDTFFNTSKSNIIKMVSEQLSKQVFNSETIW